MFVSIRFLFGAGEAVVYPASNQFVSRWIPTQERGIANGWIFAGVGAGAGLSPPLITFIMLHYGWRASFWVCAVIGLVVGLVWFIAARDTPAEHSCVSAVRVGTHPFRPLASVDPSKGARAQSLIPWKTVFKSKEVLAITISYFSFGYVAWIFFSWFYTYLAQVRGLNLKASAFYAMLPFLAMAICCAAGGTDQRPAYSLAWPQDRALLSCIGRDRTGGCVPGVRRRSPQRAAGQRCARGRRGSFVSGAEFFLVGDRRPGRPSSGSVSGFMNMGAQAGGWFTAWLTPLIASHFGWTASFLVAAALCLMGAAAWLFVDPNRTLEATPAPAGVHMTPSTLISSASVSENY